MPRGGFIEPGDRVALDDPTEEKPPRLGTVTAINSGPTYAVRFDDGKLETGWLSHAIRRIPAARPRGDEAKEEG